MSARAAERPGVRPTMGPFRFAVCLCLVGTTAACSTSRQFHVRGQLDRSEWVITTCESRESYRLIMASTQAFDFQRREEQLRLEEPEPVMVEFEAFTIPPTFPWNAYETIGARSAIDVQRGTCPGAEPL